MLLPTNFTEPSVWETSKNQLYTSLMEENDVPVREDKSADRM